jgi:hypothetical protein
MSYALQARSVTTVPAALAEGITSIQEWHLVVEAHH